MPLPEFVSLALETGRERLRRTDTIRQLNDAFRRTFVGGHVIATRAVALLPLDDRHSLFEMVREANYSFKPADDPYGEHDFGAVIYKGERFFWKIDYYDLDFRHGSPDPSDPAFTVRVMTVVRADEY